MENKQSYAAYIRTTIIRIVTILAVALAILAVLRVFLQGNIGNSIVDFFMTLGMGYEKAYFLYWRIIRGWLEYLAIAVAVSVPTGAVIYTLRKTMRNFEEILNSVKYMTEVPDKKIILSPEMNDIEAHLNHCREQLIEREKVAREAEQRKNDLVVYLAHDIRTPLTSVIGYLDLLNEVPDMPKAQRLKYLDTVRDKASRLEILINEFFDITRFNLQTIDLELQKFNLSYMLYQMADEFYPMLSEKKQTVQLQLDETIEINADPDKLARVFNNILKNAIAYGYPDTPIMMRAQKIPEGIQVCIKNQGKHIPEDKLNRLFEKFFRLDQSRATATGNAGLGLAIAREIMHQHGGDINAASEGESIEFRVVLYQ